MSVCACICVHDDADFLHHAIQGLGDVPVFVYVSRLSWKGEEGNSERSCQIARAAGATAIEGEWTDEISHRKAAYAHALAAGYDHAIIADSDEVLEPVLLDHLKRIAENDLADRVYVEWDTYWKTPDFVIRPRERFTPCILINLHNAQPVRLREFEGGRALFLPEEYGIIHHLSYVGSDERIWKKITTWGHRDEVHPAWWASVWKAWAPGTLMRNLHPTHPGSYGFAEHIFRPEVLRDVEGMPDASKVEPGANLPRPSVLIPACGGQDDLDLCIQSLDGCRDLLHETIVVDNGSAPALVVPDWVTLLRSDENLGFARASNLAWEHSSAETILFLNSDTIVPRAGLIRLLQSLGASGSIAAAGPLTDNCGHFQRIEATYTKLEHLDLFAHDLAEGEAQDTDTDMLVGFCLAVKRSVLNEVGVFDERFGLGTFEDNDLCYRMRRAGYRLVISRRAFVHHSGSKTMSRLEEERPAAPKFEDVLRRNQGMYIKKWAADLESGFASTLSGLGPDPITFHPERDPAKELEHIRALATKADISLCMIVKNEERVIRDCLESAMPFFREVLIYDTGSTDRTVEIARSLGAQVTEGTWEDSFSAARNASMQGAAGKWIMWLDADDTLPRQSGVEILSGVCAAPEDVTGFVVPVRFVEEGGFGTQVDHVKVFRNYPGLSWQGRIHEQILQPLRAEARKRNLPEDGRIVRLNAYVAHSGYDTSDAGQARKRERDDKLLKLDIAERPDHPFVLFNLGMTAHYSGEQEEAVAWLRQCIERSHPSESHLRKAYALLGASLKHGGDAEQAETALREGLDVYPGDPEILFFLAQLAHERGDKADAISLYQQVIGADVSASFTSLDPGVLGYKSRHNLALALLESGETAKALDQWRAAFEESGRIDLLDTFFDVALDAGDHGAARWALSEAQHRGLEDQELRMSCKLCSSNGIDEVAYLRGVLSMRPENHGARKQLALSLLNRGLAMEAEPELRHLTAVGIPEGPYFMGVLAEDAGDAVNALKWFEHAAALNPAHEETLRRVTRLRATLK